LASPGTAHILWKEVAMASVRLRLYSDFEVMLNLVELG